MRVKSEVTQIFKFFNTFVERKFDKKIRTIQTDLGGEYRPMYTLFQELGIERRHSCPYQHQQQGRVERKHRHIVDIGLTLLA